MGNDSITVKFEFHNDEDGFFGRECPNEDCLGYFITIRPCSSVVSAELLSLLSWALYCRSLGIAAF